MKLPGLRTSGFGPVLFLPALLAAGCGSGGGSGSSGGGAMFIDTCSLGCSNGAGGSTVSCTVVQVAVNREIDVFFSAPIDPNSVSATTFQLIDVNAGQAPAGTRFVDPSDPTKLVFRPAITFDSQGNVTFGFQPNTTYRVTIPGTAHNDNGPFITSVGGSANQSRMQCDIHTTNQVDDLVAGAPVVSEFVSLATGQPPPNDHIDDQPASGAVNVWRNSTVRFSFNDVMNPVTLLNPLTHQPTLIAVLVDMDGDPGTVTDQVPIFGSWVMNIDLQHLHTDLVFTPANGMPSSGEDPQHPRQLILSVPSGVQDLAGNGVSNAGPVFCTPEHIQYDPVVIPDADGENFVNTLNENLAGSGADWGNGRLTRGWGGGSGRLGELTVQTLQTLTIQTGGTLFKNLSSPDPVTTLPVVATSGLLDNSSPTDLPAGYRPLDSATWPTVVVTDGIFEFSSLVVQNGGTLTLAGTKPARLFSRGPATINGTIDTRGESAPAHLSDSASGGPKGLGGPNGGDGGDGGDRVDNTNNDFVNLGYGGISNPGAVIRGGRGMGVGRNGSLASGKGGINNPDPMPTSSLVTLPDRGGSLYTDIDGQGSYPCTIRQIASAGGGGGYATNGGNARPQSPNPQAINPSPPPAGTTNLPSPIAAGGDSAALGLEPPDPQSGHRIRLLDAIRNLRGGSGGGGGGTHLLNSFESSQVPFPPLDCYTSSFAALDTYFDHSGAGGGGGGGAVQIVSGVVVNLGGLVAASGGSGGSNFVDPDNANPPRAAHAAPGGGGSGGAVHVQSRLVNLSSGVSHVDVSGGLGGVSLGPDEVTGAPQISLGVGGIGGNGLVRLEDLSGGTTPPSTTMTRCSEAPLVLPFDPAHLDPNTTSGPCVGLPESESILSVGPWSAPVHRPETFSAAMSCWMRPTGNFFTLNFTADDPNATPPLFGWNMDVLYHLPSGDVLTPYRGRDANTPFANGDFESNLGSSVNYLNATDPPGNEYGTGPFAPGTGGSYLTVRFQGALAVSDISGDPCDVVLSGAGAQIQAGSLTPWVRHPSELNQFLPPPNMIRFCVIFDGSLAGQAVPTNIRGVTNLLIRAQPD
jgi:hypothetical protein